MAGFDLNDAEVSQDFGDLIPHGSFVRIVGRLRPQGASVQKFDHPEDQGLFKAASSSDAVMADWEFTVAEGKFARRKIWQTMVVEGGKLNEKNESKGWVITKGVLRGMVDSACGLNPKDESDNAKARRNIPYFKALDGIEFCAKVVVKKGDPRPTGGNYDDRNEIVPICMDKKEWNTVMVEHQDVIPQQAAGFGGGIGGFGAAPAQAPSFGGAPAGGFSAAPQQAPTQAPQQFAPQTSAAPAQPAFTPAAGFQPAGAVAGTGAPQMPSWTR